MLKVISSKITTSQELQNLMGEMGSYQSPFREMGHKLDRTWQRPGQQPQQNQGPGQYNCGICGRFLPNGGIIDYEGKCGKKPGTLLCPAHAQQFGVQPKGSPAQPNPPAVNPVVNPLGF